MVDAVQLYEAMAMGRIFGTTNASACSTALCAFDASRGTPGFELGLSLVQAIVKLQGGECRLESVPEGISAIIELPRLT